MTIPEPGPVWPEIRFTNETAPEPYIAKLLADEIRDHYAEPDEALDLDLILDRLGIKKLHRRLFHKSSELLPIPDYADGPFQLLINTEPPNGYLADLGALLTNQRGLALSVQQRSCCALQLGHTFFYDWSVFPGTGKTVGGPTRHFPTTEKLRRATIAKEAEFCRYFAYWLLLPDYQQADGPGFERDCLKRLCDVEALD